MLVSGRVQFNPEDQHHHCCIRAGVLEFYGRSKLSSEHALHKAKDLYDKHMERFAAITGYDPRPSTGDLYAKIVTQ